MNPLSRTKIILGWTKESLLALFVWLLTPIALLVPVLPARKGERETVIIIPDFMMGPLHYFRLRRELIRNGFSVYSYPCRNTFQGLQKQARRLGAYLEKKRIRQGILIGHGMGGLVPLAMPDAARQRIAHLITLAAPYHGSKLPLRFKMIPALKDMSIQSEYLLLNRYNSLLFLHFSPFSPWRDQWIVPASLSRFGQGRDLILDKVGHYNIILGKENLTTLSEFLNQLYHPSYKFHQDMRRAKERGLSSKSSPPLVGVAENIKVPPVKESPPPVMQKTKKSFGKTAKKQR